MSSEDQASCVKMDDIDLPVIDLSPKVLADPGKRKLEAQRFVDAFTSPGFCYVTGIEDYHVDELFQAQKWFFTGVTYDEKIRQLGVREHNPDNLGLRYGFIPAIPGILDCMEAYQFRSSSISNINVPEEEKGLFNPMTMETPRLDMPGREEEIERYYKVMYHHFGVLEKAAATLLSLIAEAGGERSDYFESMAKTNMLKSASYPVRKVGEINEKAYLPDGRVISGHAHVDGSLLTLLQTFGYPGLELELDGKWYAVPSKKDALIVNVGELLTDISDGRFKSTIHRIMHIGRERYAIAMFCLPAYNANINVKVPKSLLLPHPEIINDDNNNYYPYLAYYYEKMMSFRMFSGNLRFFPEWLKEKYVDCYEKRITWAHKFNRLEGV